MSNPKNNSGKSVSRTLCSVVVVVGCRGFIVGFVTIVVLESGRDFDRVTGFEIAEDDVDGSWSPLLVDLADRRPRDPP